MAEMSPLRRRMIEDMMIRNLSPATQQSYLYAVSKFSRFATETSLALLWQIGRNSGRVRIERSRWCGN